MDTIAMYYAKLIDIKDLKKHLTVIASDKFEGRESGKKGQKKGAKYLAGEYKKLDVPPPGDTSYFQHYNIAYKSKDSVKKYTKTPSENVLAYIEGTDKKNEVIVISAHYDHLGKRLNQVYNGADDDGSGTVALLEIAQAFITAKKQGHGPRRSILFISFSGEEKGLLGSKHYVKFPTYPLKNTVCDLNIDMIGRVDDAHKSDSAYVYVIGADKISTRLHNISEDCNFLYTRLTLDYKFNDPKDKNRFYFRSDHYSFAKYNVPVIFYFNGVHADYHKESDEVEKINFGLLEKRAQLVFYTAWKIANMDETLERNLVKKERE
jgi:Zn-dependent M28 family amino/carboxypeptidase